MSKKQPNSTPVMALVTPKLLLGKLREELRKATAPPPEPASLIAARDARRRARIARQQAEHDRENLFSKVRVIDQEGGGERVFHRPSREAIQEAEQRVETAKGAEANAKAAFEIELESWQRAETARLAETVAPVLGFELPEKPAHLVAAENHLRELRTQEATAKKSYDALCRQWRAADQAGNQPGAKLVKPSDKAMGQAEAAVNDFAKQITRARLAVEEQSIAWKSDVVIAMREAEHILRVSVHGLIADLDSHLAALDVVCRTAQQHGVASGWLSRRAVELRTDLKTLRANLELDRRIP